jgi:hypothetical protein
MRFAIAPAGALFLALSLSSCLATRSEEESGIAEPTAIATAITEAPETEGVVESGSSELELEPDPVIEPPPPEPEEDVYAEMSASVALGDMESAISKFEEAFSDDL